MAEALGGRMKHKLLALLLGVCLLVTGATLAQTSGDQTGDLRQVVFAVSFEQYATLNEIVDASDKVVLARVLDEVGTHYVGPDDTPVPITRFSFQELVLLKGAPDTTFLASQFGGPRREASGEIVRVVGAGDPLMLPGQEVLLFLQSVEVPDQPVPAGMPLYRLTGSAQGRMLVNDGLVYTSDVLWGSSMPLLIHVNGEPLDMLLAEVRAHVD